MDAKASSKWRTVLCAGAIAVLVLVAYAPAMRAGFVWDDDDYVTNNRLLTAPDGLKRIWFSLDSPSQYFPLVYTTFRIEHAIWGLHPAGYHIVNILLHAINALLIWLLLSRLRIRGAWLAAAIWALHPVNVESVAWVTERKNTLSTAFYLLSVLGWERWAGQRPAVCGPGSEIPDQQSCEIPDQRASGQTASRSIGGGGLYTVSLISCALALFAKTTACTVPAALLLVLWIKRLPIDRRRVLRIVPYVAMGLAMGLVSVWWEHNQQGTGGAEFAFSPLDRILVASRALWFYLGKLLWPVGLCFSYPRWSIDVGQPIQYVWLVACIAGVALGWVYRGKSREAVAAFVFFTSALVPMLGVFSLYTFRYAFVADHYQYLACVGPIAVFAALVSRDWKRKRAAWALGFMLLAGLGSLTWLQARAYHDEDTLWRDVLRKNPDSFMAYNNLGSSFYDRGMHDKGIACFRKALELNPRLSETHTNLGAALHERKDLAGAISHFRMALRYQPRYPAAHCQLAAALADWGKLDEAIRHYKTALELDPDCEQAHLGLGQALVLQGDIGQAAVHFEAAVRLDPQDASAHYNLGTSLAQMGQVDTAIAEFNEALRLKPSLVQAHSNLAVAYYQKRDYEAAWREVELAQKAGAEMNPAFLRALSRMQNGR